MSQVVDINDKYLIMLVSMSEDTEKVVIELNRGTTTAGYRAGDTLLQTARIAGLQAPYSCETGSCGTCMARVVEGTARMVNNDAVEEAFAKVRSELGPVHILVTSAGLVGFAPFTEITTDAWERMMAVNLTSTFHCCQVAVPDMVQANWGRIVMISSSSAQRGSPGMAHYAASKGALLSL